MRPRRPLRASWIGIRVGLIGLALISSNGATAVAPIIVAPVVAGPPVVWLPHREARPTAIVDRGVSARVIVDGHPVADAEVAITDGSRPIVASVRTDRDGVAHFTDLGPGPYELWASADGFASPIARIDAAATTLDLVLAPAATIHGHATIDAELPSNATVRLLPIAFDQVTHTASLDAHGAFSIAGLPFGTWRVETDVPGFAQPAEQIVVVGEHTTVIDVPLVRSGSAAGIVVDSAGAPVRNATIVIRAQGASGPVPSTFTLADTGLRWVHPLAGTRQLPIIDDARFGASRPGSRPAECGRGHCGLDIGSVRGSIVHAAADGEIAALFPESRTEAGRVVVIHHGGGLKSFYMHLDELRPGLEVGQAIHAGDPLGTLGSTGFSRPVPHVHFALTYEASGRVWYLDPEPIIRQAVVLATPRAYEPVDPTTAKPAAELPGVRVQRITTDADGAFRIDGIAPGTYIAGAFATDLAPGSSAAFAVRGGEPTTGVTITLDQGILVDGRVLGRDGPLAGATVIASAGFGETAHKVAMTSTDRDGAFALHALGGKVTLSVTAASYGEAERTIALDDSDARRGHHHEELALTIEDAHLRGQVISPEGGAAAGAIVRVVDGPTRRSGVTDAQGRFALDHVASGHYTIEIATPDAPSKRVALDSERWSEVRLEAGGSVRCAIRDAHAGAPLAGLRIELAGPDGRTASVVTDARGVAELRGLAPGDWRLAARGTGFAPASRTITVRASRAVDDVTLELVRGAVVAGVVRDRYGRRVAGARVWSAGAATVTDRDGGFRLTDVAADTAIVEAAFEGSHGTLPLQLAPGDVWLSATIELREP